MTRRELYKEVAYLYGERVAEEINESYDDCEIEENGEQILEDLAEEYRFCASVDHYRDCGY